MNIALIAAAALVVLIAIAHSFLGERYILIRLFRRADLPHLFGSDWFTKRTLRFAWHLTSLAWLGFATILVSLAWPFPRSSVLLAISITFALSAIVAATASHGKHLVWVVFAAIALLTWWAG